jgi:hypothetical protein
VPVYRGSTVIHSGGATPNPSILFPSSLMLTDNVDVSTSYRTITALVASATPHAPGVWVEIDPSLIDNADSVYAYLMASGLHNSATDSSTLMEIGVGPAGSEIVWATIPIGYRASTSHSQPRLIPGHIPAGSRVAARIRSAVASRSITVTFGFGISHPQAPSLGAPVTFGVNTGASRGVVLAPASASHTKTAWTELTASTSTALAAMFVGVQGGGVTAMSTGGILIDIGIGPAGSETVVIPNIALEGHSQEYQMERSPVTFGVDIPTASRIVARWQSTFTNNVPDIILVGAPPA